MRARIIEAALAEMNARGIRFTMSNLAGRLGMSKRTLYEHFESKEVLVEAIVDAVILDLQVQRLEILGSSQLELPEKLVAMLSVRPRLLRGMEDRIKLDLRQQFPGLWKKAHQSAQEQWTMIEQVLQEGIDAGCFRPIYIPAVRKMLQGGVNEIANSEFLLEQKKSFSEMLEHFTEIVIYGIMMPKQ